ncbi:fungal-specific transcription factor domain-containing protein [Xylaria flabelliformis]|nr:fungal-specific transcription factor domain-containing protein [Xylaria flabelliformis]
MTTKSTERPVLLANGLQPLSCLRCARHKVRCDRLDPCSKCIKNDVPCEFPPPKTGKRKRRKMPITTSTSPSSSDKLSARLDRYEEVLRSLGVDIESVDASNSPQLRSTAASSQGEIESHDIHDLRQKSPNEDENSCLIMGGTGTRHVDTESWTKIGEHFNTGNLTPRSLNDRNEDNTPRPLEHSTKASRLILGAMAGPARIEALYPPQLHFSKLWQVYLHNVQPLTMILHAPSASLLLAEAVKGHGHVPAETEALLFAVMACAVMSLSEADCMRSLGARKTSLFSRYRLGCELALTNARFLMSSDFSVLQAYTIYLFAIRLSVGPHELWNLTGIAKRNAQRLGLHQGNLILGVAPFEVEMRRRLWYQIFMLDALAAKIAGVQWFEPSCEITAPRNLNDNDLSPTIKEIPKERNGASDMMFCNLRFKILALTGEISGEEKLLRLSREKKNSTAHHNRRTNLENVIEEAEKEIELNILRYCDILNPVHMLTAIVTRLTMCKLRFLILSIQSEGDTDNVPAGHRESMFSTALRVLEYENNLYGQPATRGFHWYTDPDFPSSCLIHILETLIRTRSQGEIAERAWEQIRMLYESRPALHNPHTQGSPYATINKLTLDAWRAKESRILGYDHTQDTPTYVTILREQEQQQSTSQQMSIPPLHPSLKSPPASEDHPSGGIRQLDNLEHEISSWVDGHHFDSISPNTGCSDMMIFDHMPGLDHDLPMSSHSCNDPSGAQNLLPPLGWTEQAGSKW